MPRKREEPPEPEFKPEEILLPEGVAALDADIATAEIEFTKALRKAAGVARSADDRKEHQKAYDRDIQTAAVRYAYKVFFSYCTQTLESGVSMRTKREYINSYLTHIITETFEAKHPDNLTDSNGDSLRNFYGWVELWVQQSDKWLAVQEQLRRMADSTLKAARSKSSAQRSPGSVNSRIAAMRMRKYCEDNGLKQTEFATLAGTTDRTIRRFHKTGKVSKTVLMGIATQMGISREELLREEPSSSA